MHTSELGLLARTPDVLDALIRALPDEWLERGEGPDTFSPREVVAHLIHAERELWIPRARLLVRHGAERPFDRFDRFGHRAPGATPDDVAAALELFRRLRSASLEALTELGPTEEIVHRAGRHPDLGEVTGGQLLATWIVHDLTHLRQICRVAAKQLSDRVGPWEAYLTVLREGSVSYP